MIDEKQLNLSSLQTRLTSSVQHKMFKELKRRLISWLFYAAITKAVLGQSV